MKLIIVESPTKERTISKYFTKDFNVKSSYGHVRDLPQKKLGINIENNYAPQYINIPRAKKIIDQLKTVSKKASEIYLATDFDREGEAIAWHLVNALEIDEKKIKRITFHEITPEAIKQSLKEPRKIDIDLVNSQQARRILDRLVGYKLSPLLWKKVSKGLSAGRVQSVAVRLICDREEEIKKFVSQEYWVIKVELQKKGAQGAPFLAELIEENGKKVDKFFIGNKEHAYNIVELIKDKEFRVKDIVQKEKIRNPRGPYTTAALQQDASRILRYSPSRTMMIAQQLYEGVNIGEEMNIGLITYMRTDSMNIAESAVSETRKYIEQKFGKKYLPAKAKKYKTKQKSAQEAHECIRPTSVDREPEKIKNVLTDEQLKLYSMIWTRFVCCQMESAVYDTLTIDTTADRFTFRSNGYKLKFNGFLAVTEAQKIESEEEEEGGGVQLPPLEKNDPLDRLNTMPEQHFTEPPPRFNASSLIKELEKNGIGRPSTYAPIVETILKRRYVNLLDHRYYPTNLGCTVNKLLKEYFPEIVDIHFTANMEDELDEVAQGKFVWTRLIDEFYQPFKAKLEIAQEKITKQKVFEETKEVCPTCGAPMHLYEGRYGNFLSCSRWPDCNTKIPLDRYGNRKVAEKLDELCPQCGKNLMKRKGRRGFFIACSGFPKCRFTRRIEPEAAAPAAGETPQAEPPAPGTGPDGENQGKTGS